MDELSSFIPIDCECGNTILGVQLREEDSYAQCCGCGTGWMVESEIGTKGGENEKRWFFRKD